MYNNPHLYEKIKNGLGYGMVKSVESDYINLVRVLANDNNIDTMFFRIAILHAAEKNLVEVFRILWENNNTHVSMEAIDVPEIFYGKLYNLTSNQEIKNLVSKK